MTGRQPALVLLGVSGILRNSGFVGAAQRRGLAILGVDEADVGYLDPSQLAASGADTGRVPPAELAIVAAGDEAGTLAVLAGWAPRHEIRGVLALREEFVRPAALAADFFGVPSIGLRAAQVCRDKLLQRLYLGAWGPRYRVIGPAERAVLVAGPGGGDGGLDELGFPVVLKPTQRSASSGVRCVRDAGELRSWLGQYEAGEVVLAEEAVAGPEYSVEALVQGGGVVFESVTAKRTNEGGGQFFVEIGHSVPAADLSAGRREALLAANREIVAVLGVRDGIVHGEFRLAGDRVVLMEVNARLPGDSIPTLYRLATGASLEAALVQIALGEPASYPQPCRYARQVYLEHPPGRLKDVRVDSALGTQPWWLGDKGRYPEVADVAADAPARIGLVLVGPRRGSRLSEIRKSGDRSVMFLADSPTAGALDEVERAARDAVRIEVG